jgi:uncharacterized protein YPO0396
MTVVDRPMPGMATLATDVAQWRAESMQMINWGGFAGHHRVTLNVDSILFTGASGTGKSTVLDAYIALMMDSNTAFNGASNDNVGGRARSADQRNVLSYVRGKINTSRDAASGTLRDEVLRGEGSNTWSGIAMTWVKDTGDRVTAMRLYYAPASAAGSPDVKQHQAIIGGQFDLAAVEPFAVVNFHHTRVTARFPGLKFHDSHAKFAAALHKRLDIGKGGEGAQAMKLLARIQGGRQVASVDGLYKDMVLERPKTYDNADTAIEHFEALEASYETMRTAEQQVETLRAIPDVHATLTDAQAEADLIDTFRVQDPIDGDTALALWANRTEAALLTAEVEGNRQAHADATEAEIKQSKETDDLVAKVKENERLQRENGGDALGIVEQDLTSLGHALEEARYKYRTFTERTHDLDSRPTTGEAFNGLRSAAQSYLDGYPLADTSLDKQIEQQTLKMAPLLQEQSDLREERAWLLQRGDLIPRDLADARDQIAAQVGLDPQDLPFVAELIDLHPDHKTWREAAELVLGGFARTMLVDRNAGRQFRTRLNALRLRPRINYSLADLDQPTRALDDTFLPGRFAFRDDSPFLGWLQRELDRRYGYECVPDASRFIDDGRKRITLAGQIQNGDRGAHGGHGQRFILGFSNTARLTEVEARLVAVAGELDGLGTERQRLRDERARLKDLHDAHRFVLDTSWDAIDVAAVEARVADKKAEKERLLANSDVLAALTEQETILTGRLEKARPRLYQTRAAIDAFNAEWGSLCTRQDEVTVRLSDLEDDPRLALDADQEARLAAEYDKAATSRNHAEFKTVLGRIQRALREQVAQARKDVDTNAALLTSAFKAFQQRWPQPNLGTGVDSYSDYRAILDELLAEGLSERKDKFVEKVVDWSGEDLLGLHGAFKESIDEIEDRLVPVNEILAGLPFGPRRDRLQITLRSMRGEDLRQFRAELKDLASQTTMLVDAAEVEIRFKDLQRFMKRVRAEGGTGERDYLLDVRRHVHIEAERLDATTQEQLGIYNSLGGKSGGETQELIAFIVGAALRYQLGNENQPKPIYAPVFLDEGFVKSDSEFAGRAVNAWRGLGFQLIIGAPLDKVMGIEPYMDMLIAVTKSADGYSHLTYVDPTTRAPKVTSLS